MIVIADTAPINYLVLIGEIGVLPQMFGNVVVPRAVFNELQAPDAPPQVQQWLAHIPEWLEIRTLTQPADATLQTLDAGEREAIQLGEELHADLLLIDERIGREIAKTRNLKVIGTAGILGEAYALGYLADLQQAFDRLQQTNARIAKEVFQQVKALAEMKRGNPS